MQAPLALGYPYRSPGLNRNLLKAVVASFEKQAYRYAEDGIYYTASQPLGRDEVQSL